MKLRTSRIAIPGLSTIVFGMCFADRIAAAPPQGGGTKPAPKVYSCAGQLTRTADLVITMQAGKAFYKEAVSARPTTTQPLVEGGSISKAQAQSMACTRRVIELRVPSNASSGCPECYPNAEIHVCAGSFTGSTSFEEHCRVPASGTPEAECKTFDHRIEVYKKASGAKSFNLTALKTFRYRGFVDANGCRVAAQNLGQIHDTAEVYPNVTPPKTGTDVYRVLTLPKYKGALVDSVMFVEFERQ